MRKQLLRLSANQSRRYYDFAVFGCATLAAAVFVDHFRGSWPRALLLAPLLGFAVNSLVGVYSDFRLASGAAKAFLLSGSLFMATAALWLAGVDLWASALWAALCWGPLILPRFFLNLHRRQALGPIARTFTDAIQARGPVLVVGGAGYIGTHVVEELLRQGFGVRVLDRLFYGREPIQEFLGEPRFELVEGDVTDISRLVSAVDGASSIVHLAGLVGDPACSIDERTTAHCNIIATRMLKEVAHSFGVQRFIFASSCSVYGASDEVVDETSLLNPVSLYARTKIASEQELLSALRDDFFVTILRFATVFGHSRRPRFDLVANLFTAQAFVNGEITVHGGDQWRPFVHVADLARAVVLALRNRPELVQGEIFNVGDERLNYTVGGLAKIVGDVVSRERAVNLQIHEDTPDRRNYRVSFEKISQVLKFRSAVLLEPGVQEMVDHFKRGEYLDYHSALYSNFETTKKVVNDFQDPMQSSRLYAPLARAA